MIHLLKDVDPAVSQRYRQRITQASYEPGALVLDFDDPTSDVFFIDSGAVRVVVRNAGGREVILGDLHQGDIFGEMAAIDEASRSANITALNRSTVSRMSGATFLAMATEVPQVALRVMRVLTARVRTGNEKLLEFATLQLKHRLHAELLREARPRPGSGELVLSPPPLQHVLAGRIGGRREAVSREIAELTHRKIVVAGRKSIEIVSMKALRAAVE